MSQITADKFMERLQRESSLKAQLMTSTPENVEELLWFAKGKGFIITELELKEAMKKHQNTIVIV